MSERIKRTTLVIGSIVLLLVVAWWLFWPKPLPPPDEAKRYVHPTGYSLIVPENYNVILGREGDKTYADSLRLEDANHAYPPPALMVQRFRGEPDFDALSNRGFKQKGTFLGNEAIIMDGPTGRGNAAVWNHRIVTRINGTWFEIAATDPQLFFYDKHPYKQYLETFQYSSGATTAPATTPTSAPSTQRGP